MAAIIMRCRGSRIFVAQLVGLLEGHACKDLFGSQALVLPPIFLRSGVAAPYDLRPVVLALVAVDQLCRCSRPHGSPANELSARR